MTPGKTPVGYSITQKRASKGLKEEKLPRFGKIPSRKIEIFPLLLRRAFSDRSIVMVTEGLGPQAFHGRIVVLANQHILSRIPPPDSPLFNAHKANGIGYH